MVLKFESITDKQPEPSLPLCSDALLVSTALERLEPSRQIQQIAAYKKGRTQAAFLASGRRQPFTGASSSRMPQSKTTTQAFTHRVKHVS
jgi:hypothetical protein